MVLALGSATPGQALEIPARVTGGLYLHLMQGESKCTSRSGPRPPRDGDAIVFFDGAPQLQMRASVSAGAPAFRHRYGRPANRFDRLVNPPPCDRLKEPKACPPSLPLRCPGSRITAHSVCRRALSGPPRVPAFAIAFAFGYAFHHGANALERHWVPKFLPRKIDGRDLTGHAMLLSRGRDMAGFAAAPRDLDYSPSNAKAVRWLSRGVDGSRLLARTTRCMQLTEAGEHFYSILPARTGRHRAYVGRNPRCPRRAFRPGAGCASVSTLTFLKDHLHAFQAEHPGIELELRLSDRAVDLVRDGIHVALRGQAQLDDSSLVAVPLMVMSAPWLLRRLLADAWQNPSIRLASPPTIACPICSAATRCAGSSIGPGGPHTVEVCGDSNT